MKPLSELSTGYKGINCNGNCNNCPLFENNFNEPYFILNKKSDPSECRQKYDFLKTKGKPTFDDSISNKKWYCTTCADMREVIINNGDMLCKECKLVITFFEPKEEQ